MLKVHVVYYKTENNYPGAKEGWAMETFDFEKADAFSESLRAKGVECIQIADDNLISFRAFINKVAK